MSSKSLFPSPLSPVMMLRRRRPLHLQPRGYGRHFLTVGLSRILSPRLVPFVATPFGMAEPSLPSHGDSASEPSAKAPLPHRIDSCRAEVGGASRQSPAPWDLVRKSLTSAPPQYRQGGQGESHRRQWRHVEPEAERRNPGADRLLPRIASDTPTRGRLLHRSPVPFEA